MIIIQATFTLFLTLIFVLTINDFYSLIFRPIEVYSSKMLIFSYVLFFTLSVCLNLFRSPPILNMPLTYLAFLSITFNYKSSLNNKVTSSIFIFLGLTACEMLSPHIFSAIFKMNAVETQENIILNLCLFALSRFIPFILIKIFKYRFAYNRTFYKTSKLKFAEWSIIVSLPICSLFSMYGLYEIAKVVEPKYNTHISLIVLSILICNVVFYSLYFRAVKSVELQANQMLLEKQISSYESQYEELKLGLSDVEKFKHDTKHRLLNAISELTEESKDVQMSMLKKLDDVIEGIYSERYACYTGFSFVDIILNYQKNKTETFGINLNLNINPNLDIHIDGKILSVILGNALDNAIEACIFHKKSEIEFKIMNINDSLYISVKNNYQGTVEFIDGLPTTTKDNPESHGLGLKSIKKLVNENQGFMSIQATNGDFILQINLLNN